MKTTDNSIPVEIVNDAAKLQALVDRLRTLKEFAIDTEFDSFNKQYGINLQLVQVFDGSTCYVVDPLQLSNLSPLWSVVEDPSICLVLYAGSNDVDVLKRQGCNPRHLFDIQIAAELCQWPVTSLSLILQQEFGVVPDKSIQAAGWGNRPLNSRQLAYAANDVIYLLQLKEKFMPELAQKKLEPVLQERNQKLELASSRDYFPRLNGRQRKMYSRYSQQKLLALKILVDKFAQELNLPPFKIVQDSFLEAIVQDVRSFQQQPFPENKFHYKVNKDRRFTKALLEIVTSIDPNADWENRRKR